jgi:hypothetical protein
MAVAIDMIIKIVLLLVMIMLFVIITIIIIISSSSRRRRIMMGLPSSVCIGVDTAIFAEGFLCQQRIEGPSKVHVVEM